MSISVAMNNKARGILPSLTEITVAAISSITKNPHIPKRNAMSIYLIILGTLFDDAPSTLPSMIKSNNNSYKKPIKLHPC